MTVTSARRGPFTVVTMRGRLQAATVAAAEATLLAAIVPVSSPLHLVLDLTGVTCIDTAGLHLLARARFAARAARGTLRVIAGDNSPVRRIPRLEVLDRPPCQVGDPTDVPAAGR